MQISQLNQIVLIALFPCLSAIAAPNLKVVKIQIRERSIFAFVPPEVKGSKEDGDIEAAAHLGFAIQDTLKCLQPMKPKVKYLYADKIILKNGTNSQFIDVHNLGQAVGAVLVEPGKKAQTVYSVDGPSTLIFLLPKAASEYWHVKACEQ